MIRQSSRYFWCAAGYRLNSTMAYVNLNTKRTNRLAPKMKNEEKFYDTLPSITNKLISSPKFSDLPEVASWVKKVIEHNVQGGKHTRGLMTTLAYEMLEKPENVTEEYRDLSRVLGWCLEMVQGFFCIQDDIMDGSTTRRGAPCWYLMSNVGMGAVNDYLLMLCSITETLEIYFLKTPHFLDLVRLFHKTIFYTSMGQRVDYMVAHHINNDYSQFTIDRFEKEIVPYKNCFFTFKLPVLLALTLVKDVDMKMYAGMDEICNKISILYQIQDDFIDCFGDEAVTGKAGTDIQEGKCTWLAVTALQLCNESQKKLFTKHYASKKPEDIEIIRNLYTDLMVSEIYMKKEVELYNDILKLVHALPSEALSKYFLILLERIYKRDR